MSVQPKMAAGQTVIPDSAPFSPEQRAWLNGFFAGLLSLDATAGATALGAAVPDAAAKAVSGANDGAPWHDPAMPILERMALAEGKPLPQRLFAAMAQQDCGQCGYLCETYSAAVAAGQEPKLNLCVPGGKETSRTLKRLLEEAPAGGASPPQSRTQRQGQTQAQTQAQTQSHTQSQTHTQTQEKIHANTLANTLANTHAVSPAPRPGSREAPVEAIFRSAARLNADTSEKDTRHIVFDIATSGLAFAPGDSFGLYPSNDPRLAEAVRSNLGVPADFPIGDKTIQQSLIEDYALGPAPDALFGLIGVLVGGERRRKAKALAAGEDPDGDAASLDVLAALEKFAPVRADPEAFLECLEPLQPRLYSIASSPLASPGEVHLTVDAVRYELAGRQRLGVASTLLANRLVPGQRVKVYIQKAHGFALPSDGNRPIIMVGPGTGIAPFRSFLFHRRATGAKGRAWLFFGHQREAQDFFYRDELNGFLRDGTLTRLSLAWSREGASKVYVQDRMLQAGPQLWSWLKAGAHFYVCGDAQRMAKDVETALTDISAKAGQMSQAAARDFIAELKATGRYQADVY
jgi:sulfite reductase (NADPH) flavoprotein alpha-component